MLIDSDFECYFEDGGKNENCTPSEIYPPLQYGVPEQYLFEINDLKDMTNIPKVTRCIAMVGKMVRNFFFV